MKTLLESIWNDRRVRAPNHILWWHREAWGRFEGDELWYSYGKRCKTWWNARRKYV